MSGWVILVLLGLATFAGLVIVARPPRGGVILAALMLLVAAGGYAWQGRPGLAGRPTAPRAGHPASDTLFAAERGRWLDRLGGDAQLLDSADAFIRNGDPAYAVGILRGAVSRRPKSAMLWIGLGNALVTYADGSVTPPARYAFDRAAAVAPNNPAAAYFLGLAYAQSGDFEAAEKIWRGILIASPPDAPWRGEVAEKLLILIRLRNGG